MSGKDTKSLLGVGDDLLTLEELLLEVGGEVSEAEAEAAIDSWLQENAKNLKTKVDGYANLMEHHEGLAKSRRDEAKRRVALAVVSENLVARLSKHLLYFLTEHPVAETAAIPKGKNGLAKIDTPNHVVSVAKNGGALPVIVDVEVERDPATLIGGKYEKYVRVSYSIDKAALLADLQREGDDAVEIPFARLGERGVSLRIR